MKMKRLNRRVLALALALVMAVSLMACAKEKPVITVSSTTAGTDITQDTKPETKPAETQAPETQPTETTAPADPALEELRLRMEPSGAIAGVICLGFTELTLSDQGFFKSLHNQNALQAYPFIQEIPAERYAKTDGGEVYCIIPADPQARVKVTAWDAMSELAGDMLYQGKDGSPFLIQGNASDIMQNLAVTIIDRYDNVLKDYHPWLSLENGELVTPDDPIVLDFTNYDDLLEPQPTGPDETQAAAFNEGLDEIRLSMEPSAAIAGVIYLGYTEAYPEDSDFFHTLQNQAALLEYPFILEIPLDQYVKNDGGEVYCIIPADPEASVEICFWDVDSDTPGDVVYQSQAGNPVIIQGNASDILPNIAVTIVNSFGETLSHYRPAISLKDGTVSVPNGQDDPIVLDFTGEMP